MYSLVMLPSPGIPLLEQFSEKYICEEYALEKQPKPSVVK
jgi:hypothetical protein